MLNSALEELPKYTGQTDDIDTDLYYYGSRYYDPILGRFIQPDSIIADVYSSQALNAYAYVLGNPHGNHMQDPHGYLKLKNTLEEIAAQLTQEGQQALAGEVLQATKFYGGSASEFMGESWLVLKKVLEHKQVLSSKTNTLVEDIYQQIVQGFAAVGQVLPK